METLPYHFPKNLTDSDTRITSFTHPADFSHKENKGDPGSLTRELPGKFL